MKKGLFRSALALLFAPGLAAAQTTPPQGPPPAAPPQKIAVAPAGEVKPSNPVPGDILTGPEEAAACEPTPSPMDQPGEECFKPAPFCYWGRVEGLVWSIKHSQVPALVTLGSPGDAVPGALGQPGTQILFGGNIENEERYGERFTAGYWLSKEEIVGLEGSLLFLDKRTIRFDDSSPGQPVLARPFFDGVTGAPNAAFIATPLIQSGGIHIDLSSKLWGAEINGRVEAWRQLSCHDSYRIDILAGFRHLELDEGLGITQASAFLPTAGITDVASVSTFDQFDTRNFFYGGQAGIDAEFIHDHWFLKLLGKIAVGANREIVGIEGSRVATSPSGTATVIPGGFLAQPTNIGRFSRSEFAVLPELGVSVGYQLTCHVRASVGYSVIYLSNAVRPGDQIDLTINTSQIPPLTGLFAPMGPPRPAFSFRDTDFWAQGVTASLEFRY
jgi:hypothetical protein